MNAASMVAMQVLHDMSETRAVVPAALGNDAMYSVGHGYSIKPYEAHYSVLLRVTTPSWSTAWAKSCCDQQQ
jgi:hypothetical protein